MFPNILNYRKYQFRNYFHFRNFKLFILQVATTSPQRIIRTFHGGSTSRIGRVSATPVAGTFHWEIHEQSRVYSYNDGAQVDSNTSTLISTHSLIATLSGFNSTLSSARSLTLYFHRYRLYTVVPHFLIHFPHPVIKNIDSALAGDRKAKREMYKVYAKEMMDVWNDPDVSTPVTHQSVYDEGIFI